MRTLCQRWLSPSCGGAFRVRSYHLPPFNRRAVGTACALLLVFAVCGVAAAQTPGGNVFGSDQQIGNAIREAIKWGRNLLFLLGIVFVGWAIVNFGTDKPAAKQIIAAIGCFAFGGIVALVYSISQGNAVNLDTGFGN